MEPTPTATREQTPSGRSLPARPLPLRVGFAGEAITGGLSSAVAPVPLGQQQRGHRSGSRHDIEGLHALVVDRPGSGLDDAGLRGLCESARSHNVPVVGLRRDGEEPAWAGLADVETGLPGSDAGLTAAPAVDISTFNPEPFAAAGVAGFLAALDDDVSSARLEPSFAMLRAAARFDPVSLRTPAELIDLKLPNGVVTGRDLDAQDELLEVLHRRLGVLDHPAFHASEFERAGWIAKLCAAGVPVCAEEISESLAELLGEELTALLRPLRARDLADLDLRERASVALRRAALREHSAVARWRQIAAALGIEVPGRPMVSVILSTRRESWLEHGIAQVARQNYEPRELVVCLHGDDFGPGTSERVRSLYKAALKRRGSGHALAAGECQVIRVDGELTLGDALNAGVETANGELVTKMDDDDYYSTEHLWDLVLALEYSGADLVGKGAEFVYLQWIDLTMRRFMGDSESDHPRLAGGAMMARKAPLQEIGGWPSRSRGEDTWIVRNFKKAGRGTYRTHGFGYILNRHGQGHTWNTYVDYFLIQSQREWRGLRFDETAIEP
jgi:hypothetical protein